MERPDEIILKISSPLAGGDEEEGDKSIHPHPLLGCESYRPPPSEGEGIFLFSPFMEDIPLR
jgi:hypothetical protein